MNDKQWTWIEQESKKEIIVSTSNDNIYFYFLAFMSLLGMFEGWFVFVDDFYLEWINIFVPFYVLYFFTRENALNLISAVLYF